MNRISGIFHRSLVHLASSHLIGKHKVKQCVVKDDLHPGSFANLDDREDLLRAKISEDSIVDMYTEEDWRRKLMFAYEFRRTPKHLTWEEFGKEVECLECSIDADRNRPEEIYHISFFFRSQSTGERNKIFEASNNVTEGEGLCDLLAAIGACLTRQTVHRTIRFDAGRGNYREINLQKSSKYTSDITIGFRPTTVAPEKLNESLHPLPKDEQMKYQMARENALLNQSKRCQENVKVLTNKIDLSKTPSEIASDQTSNWGYHPRLLEDQPEEPPGTYHLSISAHAFGCVLVRAIERLIQKPLRSFYRPSQVLQSCTVEENESLRFSHAIAGWFGCEDKIFPHYTPIEAIQSNWIGADAPFSLTSIICKVRELCNLTKKNPEHISWMSVRYKDTSIAFRNVTAKLNGMGPSKLFWPTSYNSSVNLLLPKDQRKKLRTRVSIAGLLGFESELNKISQQEKLPKSGDTPPKVD